MSIKFDRCVFGCSSASLKLLLWASKSVSCHHCRRLAPGGFLLPGGFQYQYLIHLNSLYIYPVWKWLARMLWRLPLSALDVLVIFTWSLFSSFQDQFDSHGSSMLIPRRLSALQPKKVSGPRFGWDMVRCHQTTRETTRETNGILMDFGLFDSCFRQQTLGYSWDKTLFWPVLIIHQSSSGLYIWFC